MGYTWGMSWYNKHSIHKPYLITYLSHHIPHPPSICSRPDLALVIVHSDPSWHREHVIDLIHPVWLIELRVR